MNNSTKPDFFAPHSKIFLFFFLFAYLFWVYYDILFSFLV
jgi:hypothetical protein